jgi:hypothetical protein
MRHHPGLSEFLLNSVVVIMKPHPSDLPVQSSAQVLNRFIFGDALDAHGLESSEYIVHTQTPAFVCRLVGNDRTPFEGCDQPDFSSAMLFDEEHASVYVCNRGFRLYDFNFVADIPLAPVLQGICDEALATYLRLQEVYRQQDAQGASRPMRSIPPSALSVPERIEVLAGLKSMALASIMDTGSQQQLATLVLQALASGDSSLLTEAQLGLQSNVNARDLLLQTARDCIAFPEVVRADGSHQSCDLWGLPLIFTSQQGSSCCWHFPLLERLEPVLCKAFELREEAALWVSPTVFTLELLLEHGGQDLVHLAGVMDEGCDFAPAAPVVAVSYDPERSAEELPLQVAFIPILVEHGALSPEQARRCGRKALEAVMPLIQEAISAEMPYGEAELCAPMPWWDAITAGFTGINRKRLGAALALAAMQNGGSKGIVAQAEYRPDRQGYRVSFFAEGADVPLVRTDWLLIADIAPDKARAWAELSACLQEAGIALSERYMPLH